LLVIAGPSGIGKNLLMEKITSGSVPALPVEVKIPEPRIWMLAHSRRLHEIPRCDVENMMLHYDLLQGPEFESDISLQLLNTADALFFLTLRAPREIILQHLARRKAALYKSLYTSKPFGRRINILIRLLRTQAGMLVYPGGKKITELYTSWFTFCRKHPFKGHWIAIPADGTFTFQQHTSA